MCDCIQIPLVLLPLTDLSVAAAAFPQAAELWRGVRGGRCSVGLSSRSEPEVSVEAGWLTVPAKCEILNIWSLF